MTSLIEVVMRVYASMAKQLRCAASAKVIVVPVTVLVFMIMPMWPVSSEETVYEATWESLDSRETPAENHLPISI